MRDLINKDSKKTTLKIVPCPWASPEKIWEKYKAELNAWLIKKQQYEKESHTVKVYDEYLFYRVTEKKAEKTAYEIGEEIRVPLYEVRKSVQIGDEFEEYFAKGIITRIEEIQIGEKKRFPSWEMPEEPTKPKIIRPAEASYFLQRLICEFFPEARWAGIWSNYPTEIGKIKDHRFDPTDHPDIWIERGFQYLASVVEENVEVSVYEINREVAKDRGGDIGGEIGIGSWGDKYF